MLVLLAIAALPWLQGFFEPRAETDRATLSVVTALDAYQPADEECSAASYGGLTLVAGTLRVLASYTQGVVVLDASGELVAQLPPFVCEGSADELVGLAVGEAYIGAPVLALAVTTGGRAESTTWLTLYRLDGSVIFSAEVEQHVGRTTRTGVVTVIPGGLVYVAPDRSRSVWSYDAARGRYVEHVSSRISA